MKRGVLLIIGFGLLVALIVVVIVAVARSRQGPPEIITFKIWSPFDEGEVYQEMAKDYLEANPNLRFEFKYVEASDSKDYEAKVVNAIAAGTGPDIWLLRNDWLPKHRSKLAPVPETMRWSKSRKVKNAEALKALLTEAVVVQNSFDNRFYSLPLAVDSLALYLNQSVISTVTNKLFDEKRKDEAAVFDTYPETWQEAERWSQLITQRSGSTISRTGLAAGTVENTYAAADLYSILLAQRQGSIFEDQGQTVGLHLSKTLNNRTIYPGQEALDFYTSFARPDSPNYTWNNQLGDPVKAFVEGRAAMLVGYSTLATEMRRLNGELTKIKVIPLPQLEKKVAPSDKRLDLAAYWTHGVNKTSPNSPLAWGLLKHFADPKLTKVYQKKTGRLAISELDGSTFRQRAADFQDKQIFASQLGSSVGLYKTDWQTVDQIVLDMIRERLGDQSSQAAVDSAAERLKKLVNVSP